MTRREPPDDWSDARLDAAFEARARAAASTPVTLADAALATMTAQRAPVARRWAWLGAAAALGLVAVLAGSSAIGPRPSLTPGSTGQAQTTAPDGVATAAVLAALGNPIDVSKALGVRTSDHPDRELAVRGFISAGATTSCPALEVEEPAFLACPFGAPWFMERRETRVLPDPGSLGFAPPAGPAFQVAFVLTGTPAAAEFDPAAPDAAAEAVLIGHFADRRAQLCAEGRRATCALVFVVDRIAELGGQAIDVQTLQSGPATTTDLAEDVDALVAAAAPGSVIQSRRLLAIYDTLGIEPVLIADLVFPYVRDDSLVWLVTVADLRGDLPVARTFALIDGSNWFAEITQAGAQMLDRALAVPTGHPSPALPPAEPSAFDGAPRTIAGMPVLNVAQVVSQRKRDQASDRDEYAIAGWYVPPRPGVTCDPPLPALHAPTPPCDDARHWLLFDPQQWGVRPGQLRADPEEYPDVLNPIIPVDVPFETLGGWDGDTPRPMAAIVLGHFDDIRVTAFHGNAYFVVDALAWTADSPAEPVDRIVRLTDAAIEDPASVSARIAGPSGRQALVSWLTAVDGRDLLTVDPSAPQFPELTADGPAWIVRRLVLDTADGRPRVAVETGYTRDNGTRVWLTPSPDAHADLVTTIDLQDLDANTDVLHVFDYPDIVSSIARAPSKPLAWHELGPIPDFIEVARGASSREVVVRWRGAGCDREWGLEVKGFGSGPIVLQPRRYDPECDSPEILREVLLVFDEPVDLDRFLTGEPCCG